MERDTARRLADSYIERAWSRYDAGYAGKALMWIAEAMALDHEDAKRMERHRIRYAGVRLHTPVLEAPAFECD